jgi:hypothetical protein
MKLTKSQLKEIIREEIQWLNENTLTKGDYIRYYDKFKGGKMDWYIVYIDSTHVRVTTDKPGSGSPTGGFVAHVRQLQDRPYYRDMMKWMDTGDKRHIDGKTYSDN